MPHPDFSIPLLLLWSACLLPSTHTTGLGKSLLPYPLIAQPFKAKTFQGLSAAYWSIYQVPCLRSLVTGPLPSTSPILQSPSPWKASLWSAFGYILPLAWTSTCTVPYFRLLCACEHNAPLLGVLFFTHEWPCRLDPEPLVSPGSLQNSKGHRTVLLFVLSQILLTRKQLRAVFRKSQNSFQRQKLGPHSLLSHISKSWAKL